jgi:hypothetical protein
MTKRHVEFAHIRCGLLVGICIAALASGAQAQKLYWTKSLSAADLRCFHQLLYASHWYEKAKLESEMISDAKVAHIDLNNDGMQDYIFLIENLNWCGTAGCQLFIGQAGKDGICHLLYDDSGGPNVTVLRPRDNGYRRLYTPCEARFDGRQYQQLNLDCPTATIWR